MSNLKKVTTDISFDNPITGEALEGIMYLSDLRVISWIRGDLSCKFNLASTKEDPKGEYKKILEEKEARALIRSPHILKIALLDQKQLALLDEVFSRNLIALNFTSKSIEERGVIINECRQLLSSLTEAEKINLLPPSKRSSLKEFLQNFVIEKESERYQQFDSKELTDFSGVNLRKLLKYPSKIRLLLFKLFRIEIAKNKEEKEIIKEIGRASCRERV